MHGLSRREKFYVYNTLASVPIILIGKSVLIDMNNETSVAGRIVDADGYMNITLEEVVFIDQKQKQYEMDNFLIPARNIRQIHLPHNDLEALITKFFERKPRRKEPKEKTFRAKRVIQKHEEIIQQVYKN